MMRHGGKILVDQLVRLGVKRMFSVPGESFLAALDGLLLRPDANYRDNLCIVTSRPHGYRDVTLGQHFQRCDVQPFEAAEVRQFITY